MEHSLHNGGAFQVMLQIKHSIFTHKEHAISLCLLLVMAVNLISVTARTSINNDEVVLIPAAYYHTVAGQFHLVYEHPPVCKLLAGIPLLFLQPNEIKPEQISTKQNAAELSRAYQETFWQDNHENFESISFWTRMPMIALTIALGIVLFAFTNELFGKRAAALAIALFTFEPTVLAHGRVVQTDIPATFGYLLFFYLLYRYVKKPTASCALGVGFATSFALLSKFSMLLIGPILFLFFLVFLWRSPRWNQTRRTILSHMGLIAASALVIINAAYFFKHRPLQPSEMQSLQNSFPAASTAVIIGTKALSHLVPAEFVLGILYQVNHSTQGHPAGFLGMYSKTGWWYYFPVAFALKTTLPFLFLSLVSLVWAGWKFVVKRDRRFLWLLAPFGFYTLFVCFSGINIGIRYYLPAYAFLFMIGGALLAHLTCMRIRFAGIVIAVFLVGWCGFLSLQVYPHYMPYMNPLASSRPHWWYLSDSNVEWGEDVKELADYLRSRGETRVRAALLAGYTTLGFYMEYLDAFSDQKLPDTRYVAIGASFLNGSTVPEKAGRTEQQRVNFFDEFRRREPEAIIGGSIYVYRMHE